MMHWIKRNWISLLFIIAGSVAGYVYWYFIGCNSGACPLKAIWYNNVIFGGLIGYLAGSSVNEKVNKYVSTKKQSNE